MEAENSDRDPDGEVVWGAFLLPEGPNAGSWCFVHEYRPFLIRGQRFWSIDREVVFRADGKLLSRYDLSGRGGPVDSAPHDPIAETARGSMLRRTRDAFERCWAARSLGETGLFG